ncbi:hypothetical protein Tco_0963326, partial [Tanacetum coccineum]
SEPLSITALTGTEGTSSVILAMANTTTALSVTFASASSIPPISMDDYEVVHTDGREGMGAEANPFPNVDDAELNISSRLISRASLFYVRSTYVVLSVPISDRMTASIPYVNENGVSLLLDFIILRPLVCGCLTEAKCWQIHSFSHQYWNGLSWNCFPLSEMISLGSLNLQTMLSHTNFLIWLPVMVATGFASIHFVK